MNLNKLKPDWKVVKFGDVVKNANLVERNIEGSGIARIVGLEHIDPENLHMRRWNGPEESTSFTRKFIPGQTLFGKRRAYQRKVAFAEFEGICSGDILTFETKDSKVLLPELLPFICQTDAFFDYALGTSAGSLSPRTSWKALKDFEFPLPPLDEQKRIADILWAADNTAERYERTVINGQKLFSVVSNSLLDGKSRLEGGQASSERDYPMHWVSYKIGDIGATFNGLTGKKGDDFGNGAPYIPYMNIFSNDRIDPKQLDFVAVREGEKQNTVQFGDIFFTTSSETPDEVGMSSVLLDELNDTYLNSFCFGYRLNSFDVLSPRYARFFFRGTRFRSVFRLLSQGVTRFNLSKRELMKVIITLPDREKQDAISNYLEKLEEKLQQLALHHRESKQLASKLANQFVSDAYV